MNKLRVVYNNMVDLSTTTVTASSAVQPATNLKLDAKSKVWRSSTSTTSTVKVLLKVVFAASTTVGCVALPFTNLSSAAIIRVYGYTGTAPTLTGTVDTPTFTAGTTLTFDTGAGYLACPYTSFASSSNTYAFGGGTYARAYVPIPTACTSMIIEINDTIASKYVEASRLIVGNYWSPKFNTSYGLNAGLKDTSTHFRTQSGDLVTNIGPRFGNISFDLKYMDSADRNKLYSILKSGGLNRPVFISLFPENTADYDLEQQYQLYGKLTQLQNITFANAIQYSSNIDMEEI